MCKRFGIDLSERVKHGALLDARLNADVYLELIGGRQSSFGLAADGSARKSDSAAGDLTMKSTARMRPAPLPLRIQDDELAAHEKFVAELGSDAVWLWPNQKA